jgi:hypothetical protein
MLSSEYEIVEPKPHVTMRRRELKKSDTTWKEDIKEEVNDDEI